MGQHGLAEACRLPYTLYKKGNKMNFPFIIIGLLFALVGSLLAGIGWNWDKIKKKNHGTHPNVTMQAHTSGDHSPALTIEKPNIILQSGSSPDTTTKAEEISQDKPIKNFASGYSGYTLAADMNISQDHVHVEGINVRGNVNVNDSEGVELKKMKIFNSEVGKNKGRITIDRSENFNVKENVVKKVNIDRSEDFNVKENVFEDEIKVDRSNSYDVEKNIAGGIADRDELAQENINTILMVTSNNEEVMSSLETIQNLISEDNVLANALGKRVQKLDKENNGKYKIIISSHLKDLGIDTLHKAELHNLGLVFHWLDFFIEFNEK